MAAGTGTSTAANRPGQPPGPSGVLHWRWHLAPVAMTCSECGGAIPAGTRFAVPWRPYAGPGGHGWQSDGDVAVCGACQPHTPLDAPDLDDDYDMGDDDLWL